MGQLQPLLQITCMLTLHKLHVHVISPTAPMDVVFPTKEIFKCYYIILQTSVDNDNHSYDLLCDLLHKRIAHLICGDRLQSQQKLSLTSLKPPPLGMAENRAASASGYRPIKRKNSAYGSTDNYFHQSASYLSEDGGHPDDSGEHGQKARPRVKKQGKQMYIEFTFSIANVGGYSFHFVLEMCAC